MKVSIARCFVTVMIALLVVSCAAQPAKVANTQWPEVIIPLDIQATGDMIVARLSTGAGTVEDVSPNLIQARMADNQLIVQKLFYSCAACADPYLRVNFILSEVSGGTLVVSQYWRVIPQFGGGEERHTMDDNASFNEAQQALWALRDSQKNAGTAAVAEASEGVPAASNLRAVTAVDAIKCQFMKSISKGAGGQGDPAGFAEKAMQSALQEAAGLGADSYTVVNQDTTSSGASITIDALDCI